MTARVMTHGHGASSTGANAFGSQGYYVGGTIHISGQHSHDMEGHIIGGSIEAQTRRALDNLDRVRAGFDVGRSNIAAVMLCMTNARDQVWICASLFKAYIGNHRPAVSGLGVTFLAFPDQLFEIGAVAHVD